MRILILHNRYNHRGGEDTVFEAESKLLSEHGHNVSTLEFRNDSFTAGWRKVIGGLFSIFNPLAFRRTIKEIRIFHPDIVHVHNIFSAATPAVIWAAWWCGVPIVMTLHNFRLLCPSATLLHDGKIYEQSLSSFFPWDAVYKKVYRESMFQTMALALSITFHRVIGTWNLVSTFLVLSQFSRSKILESRIGIPASRLVVKPNFVLSAGCTEKKSREYLFVGRLSPEKGLPVLLKAFQNSPFQLAIVGDGPLRDEVDAMAKINPNLRVLGVLPPIEVQKLMLQAKALIFPSIWYETFGMVAIEAFSAATPVIASRLGTMAEIVQDGVNGLHFDPGNPASLKAVLDLLSGDDDLHGILCTQAQDTWERLYTPEANYRLIMEIYQNAILKKRKNISRGWSD